MNEVTETLWYNVRVLLDSHLYGEDSECRAWQISKVNRVAPKGICNITMAQDRYDQFKDYIEKDEEGNIVGMWGNYWQSSIEPESTDIEDSGLFTTITSKITYSGAVNQIKVGGSKTFTVAFYEEDEAVEHDPGEWSITLGGEEITDQAEITYPAPDKVRVKLGKDDSMIGKILSIVNTTSDGVVSQADVEVIPL